MVEECAEHSQASLVPVQASVDVVRRTKRFSTIQSDSSSSTMKRQGRLANRAQAATADVVDVIDVIATGSVEVRRHEEALGTAEHGGVNTLQEGERGRGCQPSLCETLNL